MEHRRRSYQRRNTARLDEFQLINFEFPKISYTYNPVFHGNNRAAITTAMRLQGKSGAPHMPAVGLFRPVAIGSLRPEGVSRASSKTVKGDTGAW